MIRRFAVFAIIFSVLASSAPAWSHVVVPFADYKHNTYVPAEWGSWKLWGGGKPAPESQNRKPTTAQLIKRTALRGADIKPRSREQIAATFKGMEAAHAGAFAAMLKAKEARTLKLKAKMAEYNRTQVWKDEQTAKKNKDNAAAATDAAVETPAPKNVIYNRPSETNPSTSPNAVYKKYH